MARFWGSILNPATIDLSAAVVSETVLGVLDASAVGLAGVVLAFLDLLTRLEVRRDACRCGGWRAVAERRLQAVLAEIKAHNIGDELPKGRAQLEQLSDTKTAHGLEELNTCRVRRRKKEEIEQARGAQES